MRLLPCGDTALLIELDTLGEVLRLAAALRAESARVRAAPVGTRNSTLNRAAFNLGQLVAAAMVARDVVEAELEAAAADSGLPDREIARTIRSGLEAGMQNPRESRPAG